MTGEHEKQSRRPVSRLVVLFAFVAAGGIFFWLHRSGPVASELQFVLTELEVQAQGQLLRHEHVESLTCEVLDARGEALASVAHRRPGPVSPAAELRLPAGEYTLHIEVTLTAPGGHTLARRYLRTARLDGEKVTIRL